MGQLKDGGRVVCALVQFEDAAAGEMAIDALDKTEIGGNVIAVRWQDNRGQEFHCATCNVTCNSMKQYREHMEKSSAHKKPGRNGMMESQEETEDFYCDVCKIRCPNQFSFDQ